MTKKVFKGMKVVAVALSLAGAATGCSKDAGAGTVSATEVGSIGFNLKLPNGADVSSISYKISGPNGYMKDGDIPVAGEGTTFTTRIDGLPAGTGYEIMLSAAQSNGAKDCFGSATFDVMAGQTTSVKVTLHCPGVKGTVSTGDVSIEGEVNVCAVIDNAVAMPSSDGTSMTLTSSASDVDNMPTAVTYSWTAPAGSGSFDDAAAANTMFKCSVDGQVSLVLEVSDGDCGDKVEIPVTCTSGTPVAGSGGEGGTGGVAGSEAGAGGEAGSEAGTGGEAGGGGGDACRTCELADEFCGPRLMALESSAKASLAEALVTCARTTKCSTEKGNGYSLVDCWCGDTDFDSCVGGATPGNGACLQEIYDSAESMMAADIAQRMTDDTYAIGLAYNLLICDDAQCNGICEL